MKAISNRGARAPRTEAEIRAYTLGEPEPVSGSITLVDCDDRWPLLFQREAERIRGAPGERALRIEHIGSTSVPGLAAKPIIDILLVVADSANESAYTPALERAGYVLRIREAEWHEHRMFQGPDTAIHLHVYSQGCPEIERVLNFRDRLRACATDRELYARTKRELAEKEWKYVQNYADAKSAVVEEILNRARLKAGERTKARADRRRR